MQWSQYRRARSVPASDRLIQEVAYPSPRLIEHQLLFLELAEKSHDERQGKLDVFGNFETSMRTTVQQELQDDRLDVRVADTRVSQRSGQ